MTATHHPGDLNASLDCGEDLDAKKSKPWRVPDVRAWPEKLSTITFYIDININRSKIQPLVDEL